MNSLFHILINVNNGVVNMKNENINIVVTGDIAINLLQWTTDDNNTKTTDGNPIHRFIVT